MTNTPQRKSVEEKLKHFDYLEGSPYNGNPETITSEFDALIETVSTLLSETEAELVRMVESLSDVVIIEHEIDCQKGRRPCGAVEHPHPLADRCSIRRHDKMAITQALTIIKEVFKKQS